MKDYENPEYVCDTCGSTEVSQRYEVWVPIYVDEDFILDFGMGEYHNDYWCHDCEDECGIQENEDA